jgi:hypothetical protein
MADRAPGPEEELAYKILSQVFASGRVKPVLLVVLVGTALSLFGNSLWEILQWYDDGNPPGWLHLAIGFLALPLFLAELLRLARQARERVRPRIAEDLDPPKVRGLILYLSTLTGGSVGSLEEALEGPMDLARFREAFGRENWRMPVEAVAYHRDRLQQVLLIPSSGARGSVGQVELFQRLLSALFPEPDFQCQPVGACFGQYAAGLDFEGDAESLAFATDEAYEHLRRGGLRHTDILIDITGGTKPATVVGSAVALAEGRRIQYVSTSDYRVRVYDVTYEL